MNVKLTGAVHPIDAWAAPAFMEIFNAVVLARHAADLNCKLINAESRDRFRSLRGYFDWTFAEHSFVLRQRVLYRSQECFPGNILEVHYRQMDGSNAPRKSKTT